MSAIQAARAVIAWALRGEGPPPVSPPEALIHCPGFDALGALPPDVVADACALAAARAAKLRWVAPPLGDAAPPGPGGVILAAAVAFAATAPLALDLSHACPPPTGAWDLLLRDAIAGPALGANLDATVADALRACSPLTVVFDRPPPGGDDTAIGFVDWLRHRPEGRRVIVSVFAEPVALSPHAALGGDGTSPIRHTCRVLRFREDVMARLRLKDEEARSLVLEIYEAALVHHGERTLADIAAAIASLSGRDVAGIDLDDALALASFWGPLSAIRSAFPNELRKRPYLDVNAIIEGTRLFTLARALTGELS